MATYLEELHELFPNGLHVPPPVCEQKVELLIDLFDDVKVEDNKVSSTNAAAHDLVDAILYQIDPSLVSKDVAGRFSPPSSASIIEQQKPSKNAAPASPLKIDTVKASADATYSIDGTSNVSSQHSPASPTTTIASARHSPKELHDLAGKAIARKYDVFTTSAEGADMKKVERPVLVPKESTSRSSSAPPSKPVSPTSPTSSRSTSEETSPIPVRFISIAGNSARAQAEAQKRDGKSADSNRPTFRPATAAQPAGRLGIFNKVSVRPAAPTAPNAPMRRSESSSESEDSPRRARAPSSYRSNRMSRPPPSTRTTDRRKVDKQAERLRAHHWEYDGSDTFKPALQGRYISSGQIIDRSAPPVAPEPDFTGYKNGWKPITSATARRPGDGYVLGASTSRYNNASDDEQEPEGPTPFHWTGDVDIEPGKRRIIGKGALGSRPGTFKSRSDERFAAATAALERDQEQEYASRAPDPIENMHPAAASWEMQRRGILLRNDKRARSVRA